jgi:glycosyltransferase involved in cell wall biosynthesis
MTAGPAGTRVLFLSTSMGMGGADSQLMNAAQELQGRGHEVLIVSLTPLGPMGLQAQGRGIPTRSLEMSRGIPDPRGLLRLARWIREWRPDVVHSHMVHANLMARAVRLLAPVPVLVQTIHNIYEGGPFLMACYRLTNGLVDGMTIISEAAAERFIRERIVPRELLRVVANGVDPDLYRPAAAEARREVRESLGVGPAFCWLAVGRFEVAKDYPTMLRAFAAVVDRRPDAVLLLAGRGSLQGETEALGRELKLESRVRFLGVRDDVPALVGAADGYLMSSAWEGLPMVLLEAASCGLPIVTTRVGGTGEAVVDGMTGFLAPPSDPGALAAAMLRLMDLPEPERRRMGERGREHIRQRYGLARVVEEWEEVYREASARRGVTSPRLAESPGVISERPVSGRRGP